MTNKKDAKVVITVTKEREDRKDFYLRVSNGEKRVVFKSSFLRETLESALYQEICLTSFGTAALCFFALMEADVTKVSFSKEDNEIFKLCSGIMIDRNDLSLSLDDGTYLHIPLAKQWENKFIV